MKNVISVVGFIKVTVLIATLFIMPSCDNKNDYKNCLAVLTPDTLRFNIVDKNTGNDLFFSANPVYTTEQIQFTIPDMEAIFKPEIESSPTLGKHFYIKNGVAEAGTIKIFLANKLEYTMEYSMKLDTRSECRRYVFDKVVINGQQKEENLSGRVIQLRL